MQTTIREGNSGVKFGLTSLDVLRIMSEWALTYNQFNMTTTKKFGVEISQFFGSGWTLNVMRDDQFETDTYREQIYILDKKFLRHHIFRGLPDTMNMNVTGPKNDGDHTMRHQFTGVHTLEMNVPGSHARIENITS